MSEDVSPREQNLRLDRSASPILSSALHTTCCLWGVDRVQEMLEQQFLVVV
jgi:hypothetical protein